MRVTVAIGCFVVVVGLMAGTAHAQFGRPWSRTPTIAVIGSDGDFRLGLVDEAIAFWNKTLEDIGSGFRLGAFTRIAQPVPEEALGSTPSPSGWSGFAATFPR